MLKALNKPAVPSHLGPITSAHQGPVFWEKNPRPILFSASFGVSADCQPLWLGVLHPRLRPPLHLPIQTVALVFFLAQGDFLPTGYRIELDSEEACLYEEYGLPCDLQDPGARNISPIRREIDHPNRSDHSSPNIIA